MSRDGLIEKNLASGEEQRLSRKEKELDFSSKQGDKNINLGKSKRKSQRFQFSEEELNNPKLKKQIKKVNLAEDKLDKAYEKIPTKKKLMRRKVYEENTENPQILTSKRRKTTFHVEDVDKKPKYRQKFHQPVEALKATGEKTLHGKIYEVEKENVGVEAGHQMQEEVEQKTIALSVRTARLTAEVLQKAFRQFLEAKKNHPKEFHKGQQTLKQLMEQNTGVSSIEINNDNIKDFETTAKKYGIDFALKKDVTEKPPRYIVFFKGRDADVMTEAFKEYMNLAKEKNERCSG